MIKKIAITGKTGVGKTYFLNILKNKGYSIFNCDEYVNHLYQKDNLGYIFIKDNFGVNFINKDFVDKKQLRSFLAANKNKLIELENFLHPVIYQAIKNSDAQFVEIPKIKSKKIDFNDLFAIIINVEIAENERIKNLEKRGVNKIEIAQLNIINEQYNEKKNVNIYVNNEEFFISFLEKEIKILNNK